MKSAQQFNSKFVSALCEEINSAHLKKYIFGGRVLSPLSPTIQYKFCVSPFKNTVCHCCIKQHTLIFVVGSFSILRSPTIQMKFCCFSVQQLMNCTFQKKKQLMNCTTVTFPLISACSWNKTTKASASSGDTSNSEPSDETVYIC
jgi:hypothetical protein